MKPIDRLREHVEEIELGRTLIKKGIAYRFTASIGNVLEYEEFNEDGELIEHWYSDPMINEGAWIRDDEYIKLVNQESFDLDITIETEAE